MTLPFSQCHLLVVVGFIVICNGNPMMKMDEEKKVPPAAFWPYILHPTRFLAVRHKSDENDDYYDAARDEDATSTQMTTTRARMTSEGTKKVKEEEEEARQLQRMMTMLLANLDPVPMFTASTPKSAQIVTPKRKEGSPNPSMFKVDAETYDDERAEAGKDDEDAQEWGKPKFMDKEFKQHKQVEMLDGPNGGIREADAEADGIVGQMPSKGTVDGQTHFFVDGETGEGAKMNHMAAKGAHPVDGEVTSKLNKMEHFPKPPVAEIIRIIQ